MVRVVGSSAPFLDRFGRRGGRDQAVAAVSDQVLTARLLQRLADFEVVLGFEELHERALHLAVAQLPGDVDGLASERIDARIVHGGGDVERRGDEILNLIGLVAVSLEEHRQVDHGVQIAAGMAGNEIRHQVLLAARLGRFAFEHFGELFEIIAAGLAHQAEHCWVGVFRSDFQMAAHVMPRKFPHVFGGSPS